MRDCVPEPSPAEIARTAVARARVATLRCGRRAADERVVSVSVRASASGEPTVAVARSSPVIDRLLTEPGVLLTFAAPPPFRTLELTGDAWPHGTGAADQRRFTVAPRSLRLVAARVQPVALADYLAAQPDPLWREAERLLRHLDAGHRDDLLCCLRAQGFADAEWVTTQQLDRYGLDLAVLTGDGVTSVRLAFPDEVGSLSDAIGHLRRLIAAGRAARGGSRDAWGERR